MELVDHERPAGRAPTVDTPNFTCLTEGGLKYTVSRRLRLGRERAAGQGRAGRPGPHRWPARCRRPSGRCRTSETRWIIDEGGIPIGGGWVHPTDLIATGQQAAEEAALPAAG